MKETVGKAVAREYFYRVFLPSVLPARLLRSSNYLLLLGEDFQEMGLLTELGVPPYRIFSVERDKQIYDRQRRLNQQEDLGIALFFGELEEYLRNYRFSEHKFGVFNLDICGSNLRGIDPALGEILLFCRRNTRSVVGTYTSAGRDRPQLQEGLKSLAFLLWLQPETTARLVSQLNDMYMSSDLLMKERSREVVSRNMVLRHLFWLRSHLEHIALGSYMLGITQNQGVRRLMELQEMIWNSVVSKGGYPLTYRQLRKLTDTSVRHVVPKVTMDLGFSEIQSLTYSAYKGFYQCCYFATYDLMEEGLGLEEWYGKAVDALLGNPLLTVNTDGVLTGSVSDLYEVPVNIGDMVLWNKADLQQQLRVLGIPPVSPELSPVIYGEEQEAAEQEETREVPAIDGHLSETQIAGIRRLATGGFNTEQIVRRLSIPESYRGSVTAYIATTRRQASS
jgi:hypothetical protein